MRLHSEQRGDYTGGIQNQQNSLEATGGYSV